jgi:hypothetical protein
MKLNYDLSQMKSRKNPYAAKLKSSLMLTFLSLTPMLAVAQPIVRELFHAEGVSTLVLRASGATQAKVTTTDGVSQVEISASPNGGAKGYHPADPSWKETPASEWGLGFVSERFGATLVISSKSKIQYIHHRYVLENIELMVPAGVTVVREARTLSGDGNPNLSAP